MRGKALNFVVFGYGMIGMIIGAVVCYASIKSSPGGCAPSLLGLLIGAYVVLGAVIIPDIIKRDDE